jgi:alkylation response protein AidB-like acyl-CoA dehydrogenase
VIEWSDEELMVRDAVRGWIDAEVRPVLDDLDAGELAPYGLIRKLYATFGMDEMARSSFKARIAKEREHRGADADDAEGSETGTATSAETGAETDSEAAGARQGTGDRQAALTMLPVIELCKVSPGLVTAMGVSLGLTAGTIMKRGTVEQKERWALDLLTFDKVGAWAITEPNSGSDAFGGMQATARKIGDEYLINGAKTFITNGPYADTIVFYCKLDDGRPARDREILTFVLDRGMPGLDQSRPLRKMGLHSSPTGELFLNDVRAGADRLRLSVDYARTRVLWDRPIGDYQLIQLKLATMEIARLNVQNLVFRHVEMQKAGRTPTLAEASAMKLYAARAASEVAMEAVQLFGGNGYMSEYRVEQLARDAKSFQIYAGTDEIQVTHIARDLLSR